MVGHRFALHDEQPAFIGWGTLQQKNAAGAIPGRPVRPLPIGLNQSPVWWGPLNAVGVQVSRSQRSG